MKKELIRGLHITVWILLIFSDAVSSFSANSYFPDQKHVTDFTFFIKCVGISAGFHAVAAACFYASCFFVARQLFAKRNYFSALGYTLLIFLNITLLRYGIEFYFFKPVFHFDNYSRVNVTFTYYISNVFLFYLPGYFTYGLIYFFVESWYATGRKQQDMQREKLITELSFLRSQINPHFLFNTISDIYTLTYQQAAEAPEALLKLSELLRYMLRDGTDEYMLLSEEIGYIDNFIELQRISLKGNAFIDFNVNGEIADHRVASLLFISFVENAIKHGEIDNASFPVTIKLDVVGDRLRFLCINRKNNAEKDKVGGIGLKNVKRRLELLYPERHSLNIIDHEKYYEADLNISLK